MSPAWAELRAAIAKLNYLMGVIDRQAREIAQLRQALRDARGG